MNEASNSSTRSDALAVKFERVSKTYSNGARALTDVSFDVPRAAIHAICGENGAGKSTLMKILFGIEAATTGQILIDGEPTSAARRSRIGMVHQHFSLIPTLTVTENIVLGQEPMKGVFFDRSAARAKAAALIERFHLQVNLDTPVSELSVAARQKVEILKALSRDTRILILDEPTAVLTPTEIEELFRRLHAFRQDGMTIIFISHKLNEVRELADKVTILRSGRYIGTEVLEASSDQRIMKMVMGADIDVARRSRVERGAPLLVVDKVDAGGPGQAIRGITFALHKGEIIGVAGVDGGGQEALVAALSGRRNIECGEIRLNGEVLNGADTATWRDRGLAHLPSDRFTRGGAPGMTVAENLIAGAEKRERLMRGPFLNKRAIASYAERVVRLFDVRCHGIKQPLGSLSGGNAQKVIAARELAAKPKFLIADQPTRGIDVAAAASLHRRIDQLTAQGGGVLLVTADLDELLRLSDRILVLFGGRIVAIIENGPEVTPATLGPYMLGLEAAA